MDDIFEKIRSLNPHYSNDGGIDAWEELYEIILQEIDCLELRELLYDDFKFYKQKGFQVFNEYISINNSPYLNDKTNKTVIIEFDSIRNHIRFNYEFSEMNSDITILSFLKVLPNFNAYDLRIQKAITLYWAKYIKAIYSHELDFNPMFSFDTFSIQILLNSRIEYSWLIHNESDTFITP
ncbi:hypothetical protein [Aureibacter tunicatorum]|uniref:Uncharacterized protein n=1 Tax=Aureibacter tunicatorum TaxID=866807 RepID=A0AAE3XQK2_9BACT|nr:hypothetical protein [Aureibacter tunicatorum]MDR6240815.1 hypothetical protein [Aureibacter tunicatorum]BDD06852.1 hypothetical protein AUTU_43350 [Aureibacter tunicatorum]